MKRSEGPLPVLEEEAPPILGTWPRLYGAVLGFLAIEVLLFYLLTRAFS